MPLSLEFDHECIKFVPAWSAQPFGSDTSCYRNIVGSSATPDAVPEHSALRFDADAVVGSTTFAPEKKGIGPATLALSTTPTCP